MISAKKRRLSVFLLFAISVTLTVSASAALVTTYHAPAITVVAPFAPSDLNLTVTIFKNTQTDHRVIPVEMETEHKGWEMQYFLRREGVYSIRNWYGNAYDFKDATLTIERGGESRTLPIPAEFMSERKTGDCIQLNWRTGKMSSISPLRTPLLLLMWSTIAIAVEAIVLWFYGYRNKRSWLALIVVNLLTQSAHHMIVSRIDVDIDCMRVYGISLPLLFLVEMIAFLFAIEEHDHDRAVSFAVTANTASQAVLIPLLSFLPT
ncbi:MAG: hypothetical protein J5449_03620 [Oscillospiraceae bacterium]|nr:hypothetical protein [Oscillospiraceae bacterium]